MRDIRLGDDIDDFCVRCKRIMNHAVVSVISAAPAKVRCRTCHSDHDFRHEQAPPPKVDPRKAALFNQVLSNVAGSVPAAPEPPVEAVVEPPGEAVAAAVGDPPAVDLPIAAKPKARKKAKA